MEKVILTTGGTGGHIFPALAVAEELRKRQPDIKLLFMGSLYGPEKRLAEKNAIDFAGFNVRGFLGRGLKAAPAALNMLRAIWQARSMIRKFKPDIVAGFGGYASFAPVLAAWLTHRPVLIHEQNAIAGSGNRFLSRLADNVCVSIEGTSGLHGQTRLSGNPVRATFGNICQKRQEKKEKRKRLLILGGSQGAHSLNVFITENLEFFKKEGVSIRHQTGEKDLEDVRKAYQKADLDPAQASAFIDDMAALYEWADLILCRAGASTIAELCACGLAAVFVPFPAAIHDHQTKNARAMEAGGAALLVPEGDLNSPSSLERILNLLNDKESLERMDRAAHKMARLDAAKILVDCMEETVLKKKGQNSHE